MSSHGLMAHLFLVLNNISLFECIYASTEGHRGRFQVLTVMKKVDINIHVQGFVWVCF